MHLHRKELNYLNEWFTNKNRKPLVIRGARQVGKSTLVRMLATKRKLELVELNFERNPEYRDAFSTNDPSQILNTLELLIGKTINTSSSLLFLDEIQSAPEVLPTLRYFYEELKSLPIIAAGSLLEFTLKSAPFSMPVGRIEYMHLGPMQFKDFLCALDENKLVSYLDQISVTDILNNRVLPAVHKKYMDYLKQYLIVGGMPEAVAVYKESKAYIDSARVQNSIVETYRDDFHKYPNRKIELIRLIYARLPVLIGTKFKYANVSRDYRAAEINEALEHLCLARIAIKIFHSSANGVPLDAEVNHKFFKILFLDVGLFSAALKLNYLDLDLDDLNNKNRGAVAEQFIGQHLLYNQDMSEVPNLHYWIREAKSSSAELDYVINVGSKVVPVEIKSGKTGRLKSLHQFVKEKKCSVAIRFNLDLPSIMQDEQNLTSGESVNYQLLSLPLYMVEESHRLIRESQTLKKG